MLPIRDFNYAGLNAETGEIISCQMYLPMPEHGATTADFFNPLIRHIERMVIENARPLSCRAHAPHFRHDARRRRVAPPRRQVVTTPEMAVRYTAPNGSLYWDN